MLRTLIKAFALLVLGLAVLVTVAALAFRPTLLNLVETGLEAALAARGLGPASIEIQSASLTKIVVGPVKLGGEPGLSFSHLEADYSLSGLVSGRAERVTISGLRANASLTGAEFAVDLPKSGEPSSSPSPISLPFAAMDIDDAEVAVKSDWGVVRAGFTGTVDPQSDDAIAVAGRLRLGHADGGTAGDVDLTYSPDGSLAGRLTLDTGAIETGRFGVHLVGADIDFSRAAGGPPKVAADLNIANATVPQAALGPTRLIARFDGNKAHIETEFRLAGDEAAGRLTIDALDVDGPAPTAAASGAIAVSRLGRYAALLDLQDGADAKGRLGFELHGVGPELLRPAGWLVRPGALPAIEGWIDVTLDRADLPGMASGLAADGRLTLRSVDDGLEAHFERNLTLSAENISLPAWRQATQIVSNLTAPLSIDIAPSRDRTLLLRATMAGPELQLLGGADIRVDTAGQDLFRGDGAFRFDRIAGEPWRVTVPKFALQSGDLDIGGRQVRVKTVTGNLASDADGLRAGIDADIGVNGPDLRQAALSVAGRADWLRDSFRFGLSRCAVISAQSARVSDVEIGVERLEICEEDGQPLLSLADIGSEAATARLALRSEPAKLRMDLSQDADEKIEMSLDLSALTAAAGFRLADLTWNGELSAAGIGLDVPALQLAVAGIDLDGAFSGDASGVAAGRATIAGGLLRDTRAAPVFAPIKLSGGVEIADAVATFSAKVTDRAETVAINADGTHRLADGSGTAVIAAEPMLFSPDGLQPQKLLPILRGQVSSVSGEVRARSSLAWDRAGLRSNLDLGLADIGLQTAFAALTGISGDVAFDSLLPPATPPHQKISIRLLDVGLPLADGNLDFTLGRDGRLLLHAAEWPWAGGRIFVRDAALVPGAARQELVLSVADVDIAELLDQLEVPDLTATGRFSGRIPVTIEGEKATIRNARLTAGEEGGVIRYRDKAAKAALGGGGESGELLIAALEDFRYESLVVELNGETDGNIDVLIHLRGANPQVYEGYPFELNLTLGGELLSILRRGLAGYQAPDRIREQLEVVK